MGARLYRALARILPRAFREEFGDEMCRVAEEQWSSQRDGAGLGAASAFWFRQSTALIGAAVRLRGPGSSPGGRMERFRNDIRLAFRGLRKRPGFTLITVGTLGIGIGSTTAIFSAVHTVVLRPLPYLESDRVAVITRADAATGLRSSGVAAANMADFREATSIFSEIAVAEPWSLDLYVDGRAESLRTWTVSPGFFSAVGAEALLGRTFTSADYDQGDPVVVLSHRTWQNRFQGRRNILGSSLALEGGTRTVVGVLPPDFRFPDAGELWIPRLSQPWDEDSRAADYMAGVGRIRPGASWEQARAEAGRIAAGLEATHPQVNSDLAYSIQPFREYLLGSVRTPLAVLMASVLLVLLIACANVAGLMLARGSMRSRDYAIRGALGASGGRLMSHVTAESVLLASAGCALGIALTYGGISAINALGPEHLPRIDELDVDRNVLAFAVLASGLSALLSALWPSVQLSRPDLRAVLGESSRSITTGRSAGRLRSQLVVAQIGITVVLLAGAGLFLRSFTTLLDEDLGFDPSNRVALQVFAYDYESPEEAATVIYEMADAMRAIPGVGSVALSSDVPGAADGSIARIDVTSPVVIEDRPEPPVGQEPITALTRISPEYLSVMGIALTRGRDFTSSDRDGSTPVAIVNEAFARRHFGDGSVLGQRVTLGDRSSPAREIVGVVADIRPHGHASEPRPETFLPIAQSPTGSVLFLAHHDPEAESTLSAMSEAVWSTNPSQSIYGQATLEDLLADWYRQRRFNVSLLGTFALIATLLSAVGIYGLVSFSVEQRMGELGIRRALGGKATTLLRLVLGEGLRLALGGLVFGLAASWYLTRFVRGMLYEVEPSDPITFVGLTALVMIVAVGAAVVPALRAMQVDPANALRAR